MIQGSWSYTHTAYNRLATAKQRKLVGVYGYNGLGQRISKIANGITQNYIYGLNGALLQEADGTNSVEYIHLNGQPLAVMQRGNVYYIHNDHLGSPRVVTDVTKSIVWSWDSDPFGTTEPAGVKIGKGKNAFTFTLNLRFPGQYYDSETGLHYNYFRYYDPSTGRYITSDPIGLQGGLNTYGYVGGNPVGWIDPKGLEMPIGMFADSNPDNATGRDIAIAAGLTVAPLLIAVAPELASVLAPRIAPGLIGAGGSGFGSWVSGNCTEQILIDSSIGFFGGAAVGPLLASRLSGLSMFTPHSSFLLASTTSASTAFIGDLTSQVVTTGNVNASRSFNATVFGGASGMAAGFSLMHRGGNALNFAETLGGEAFSSFLAVPSNLHNRADNSCNNPCR